MVSTPLINISQIGNLPQIRDKNKTYLKPPPRFFQCSKRFLSYFFCNLPWFFAVFMKQNPAPLRVSTNTPWAMSREIYLLVPYHPCMIYRYTYIYLRLVDVFMVNVSKYTIHGILWVWLFLEIFKFPTTAGFFHATPVVQAAKEESDSAWPCCFVYPVKREGCFRK